MDRLVSLWMHDVLARIMKVKVHVNLHNGMFSIQDYKTGRVIGHFPELFLRDVTFKVNERVRREVNRKGVKNVHAWVVGELVETGHFHVTKRRIAYNPYVLPYFHWAQTGTQVKSLPAVFMKEKQVWAATEDVQPT